MSICDASKVFRWGSIGVIEREVSALKLFQTPRPAFPKMIFQNATVLQELMVIQQRSSLNVPSAGWLLHEASDRFLSKGEDVRREDPHIEGSDQSQNEGDHRSR